MNQFHHVTISVHYCTRARHHNSWVTHKDISQIVKQVNAKKSERYSQTKKQGLLGEGLHHTKLINICFQNDTGMMHGLFSHANEYLKEMNHSSPNKVQQADLHIYISCNR